MRHLCSHTPGEALRGDDDQAERLYASLGFARHEMIPDFVTVGGSRFDMVHMSLDLRRRAAR